MCDFGESYMDILVSNFFTEVRETYQLDTINVYGFFCMSCILPWELTCLYYIPYGRRDN